MKIASAPRHSAGVSGPSEQPVNPTWGGTRVLRPVCRDPAPDCRCRPRRRLRIDIEVLLADSGSDVVAEVERITEDSARDAFQVTVLVMGLVALVGYVWAFWIPKRKLEGDVVEEAVRGSSLIPKVQIEAAATR